VAVSRLLPPLLSLALISPPDRPGPALAVRAPPSLTAGLERFAAWARRERIRLDVGPEGSAVPLQADVLRLSAPPASEEFRRRLSRFPIRLTSTGFVFDGRAFEAPGDALLLCDPRRPRETLVFGNTNEAALRLAYRRLRGAGQGCGYRLVSGELSREGRFVGRGPGLAFDRSAERDEIAERDRFLRSMTRLSRDGVVWRYREAERAAAGRWDPVLRRFLRDRPVAGPLTLTLFPDAATKAKYTGSSRPADLWPEQGAIRVDLDASASAEPDLITPVLAGAALASQDPALARRPLLLAAAGARTAGRWWGRNVNSFAAFTAQARVEPTVDQVVGSDPEESPVLMIGAAASWLEAGARMEGEQAVRRALAGEAVPLTRALARWRAAAVRERAPAPLRRRLPAGFLRGVSYAMTNSIEGAYASARSRRTLERLVRMSANSVSVMPYAFAPDPSAPAIAFVHRHPRGETDEGTASAVRDARSLGMTSLVKPQIWLRGGAFVGQIVMRTEEDWARWFDRYRRFVVHHAVVAEAAGAALFCVGTELSGTEARGRDWRETIAAARRATGAPLLYASNWASQAPRVSFWDALDLIGVSFYDPLSTDPAASDAVLEEGVRRGVEPLERLSRATGKPVLFAEAGYPPVRGAWTAPHDETSERTFEPRDAARAVEAVFRALGGTDWWKGVYWWKVFSGGEQARQGERTFNLLGTPAGRAVAAGFARLASEGGN
jgi:hypothetical protein